VVLDPVRLSLAHRPCEGDDLDARRPGGTEGGRRGTHGRTGGVHVVDEEHRPSDAGRGCERAADVRSAGGPGEPGLPHAESCSYEERIGRQPPPRLELTRQTLRGMMPAPKLTSGIRRDIRDDVCGRLLDAGDDELGSETRGAAEAVLLPAVDERASRADIGDARARRGECEPATCTFAAPLDRPRGRRTTTSAPRRCKEA
jgi:hypothetical protein